MSQQIMYTLSAIPYAKQVQSDLNEWLFERDSGYKLQYNFDDIDALSEKKKRKADRTIMLYQAGLITDDESKRRIR